MKKIESKFEGYIGYSRVDNWKNYNYENGRYLDAVASLFHTQAPVTACMQNQKNLYISYNQSAQPAQIARKEFIEKIFKNTANYNKDLLLLSYLTFNEDFASASKGSKSDLDHFIDQCRAIYANELVNDLENLKINITKYKSTIDAVLQKSSDSFKSLNSLNSVKAPFTKETFIQDILNDQLSDSTMSNWIAYDISSLEDNVLTLKTTNNTQELGNLKNKIDTITKQPNKSKEDIEQLKKLNHEFKTNQNNIILKNLEENIEPSLQSLKKILDVIKKNTGALDIITAYKAILYKISNSDLPVEKYNLESLVRPIQDCYKLYHKYKDGFDIAKIYILDNAKNLHADTNIVITMRLSNKEKSYIGVSKLTCGYCHNELEDNPHRGTHGICDDGWNYYLPTQENLGLEEFSQNSIKLRKVPKKEDFKMVNQRKDLSFDDFEKLITLQDNDNLYNLKIKCGLKEPIKKENLDQKISKGLFGGLLNLYEDKTLKGINYREEERNIEYINPYFGKYTLDALDLILHLRISDLQLKNVKTLQGVFIDQKHNNFSDLIAEILNTSENKILVPLNLFNKHATGLIFERTKNNSVQVKYIDTENKSIPIELLEIIKNTLPNVLYEQIQVEQQKYSTCGPEVIENFILYLIGKRTCQEKAIELHSKLVENALLGIKSYGIHLLFEELANYYQQPENNLETNKCLDCAYNDVIHNLPYDNLHPALLGQDHNETI